MWNRPALLTICRIFRLLADLEIALTKTIYASHCECVIIGLPIKMHTYMNIIYTNIEDLMHRHSPFSISVLGLNQSELWIMIKHHYKTIHHNLFKKAPGIIYRNLKSDISPQYIDLSLDWFTGFHIFLKHGILVIILWSVSQIIKETKTIYISAAMQPGFKLTTSKTPGADIPRLTHYGWSTP